MGYGFHVRNFISIHLLYKACIKSVKFGKRLLKL